MPTKGSSWGNMNVIVTVVLATNRTWCLLMLFFPFSKALDESFKSSADPGLKHVQDLKIGRHKYVCSKVIKIHFHIFL